MYRNATVRRSRPALEALEARDVPSFLPALAQSFLVPLVQQQAAASSASLATLQKVDAALLDIQNGTPLPSGAAHATSDQAAILYAGAAATFQDVLTERRALELSIVSILDFFGSAIMQAGDVANDTAAFQQIESTQLQPARATALDNETKALALNIVTKGVTTLQPAPGGASDFVIATLNGGGGTTANIEVTYPPLEPKQGSGIISVPQYNYSQALWPLAYNPATGQPLGGPFPDPNP